MSEEEEETAEEKGRRERRTKSYGAPSIREGHSRKPPTPRALLLSRGIPMHPSGVENRQRIFAMSSTRSITLDNLMTPWWNQFKRERDRRKATHSDEEKNGVTR